VEVEGRDGSILILDAGTGIRRFAARLPGPLSRIDILLTHLHLDHIQGLGFFAPLYDPDVEVHIWGPASVTQDLATRLTRYLSPPLFPVHLRYLPCRLVLHEVPRGDFEIGGLAVSAAFVCHPGPTVGYRIAENGASLAYLPDHDPALGARAFPISSEWTSGYALAAECDLLIHDAMYTEDEYRERVGWGHCTIGHAIAFAELARVRHLVLFHHDPSHTDATLTRLIDGAIEGAEPSFRVTPAVEEAAFDLGD
jgi:phosphoribosyl 1,2-cyclic phosphodiesterase